jgi:hypothetical protein
MDTVMRLLTLALVLLLCLPAATQAPPEAGAVKPAAPARPAAKANPGKAAKTPPVPAPAKAFYAAMPEAERSAIQSDLVWTGDYNGMVGVAFEDRAIAAVQSFQKRNAGKETGILNPDERSRLAQSAKAKQERVGWRVVDDPATGARLGIPAKLVPQAMPGQSGGHWQSGRGEVQVETFRVAAPGTTLAAVFEQQKKEPSTRQVEYNVLRADFFVLSGLQGLKKFYVRGQVKDQAKDNDVRGMTILYDQAMEGTMDQVAVAMSSAFAPFPAQAVAAAPSARRPVEYGSGLVVSSAGHIVTDADLLTGCDLIVVPGFGHADRVAEEGGVALLRINGARDLAPVALAAGAPSGDVTLVGIADPQAQNGGKAVSTARGRASANGALDPLPAAGFAGAAAIDATGSVAGIVGLHAPGTAPGTASVVPAPAIAKFLGAQNVAPATGRAGLDAVKAAAVRVVCIRK